MPVGHFLRESAFSIHYETYEIYSSMSQKTKGSRSQDRPTKKMSGHAMYHICNKTQQNLKEKEQTRQERFFSQNVLYFHDRSIKKSYYFGGVEELDDQYCSKCCRFHWVKKTIGSHQGLVRTRPSYGFFPCRPRWHFMMNFAWKRLVGISQNIGNNAS